MPCDRCAVSQDTRMSKPALHKTSKTTHDPANLRTCAVSSACFASVRSLFKSVIISSMSAYTPETKTAPIRQNKLVALPSVLLAHFRGTITPLLLPSFFWYLVQGRDYGTIPKQKTHSLTSLSAFNLHFAHFRTRRRSPAAAAARPSSGAPQVSPECQHREAHHFSNTHVIMRSPLTEQPAAPPWCTLASLTGAGACHI